MSYIKRVVQSHFIVVGTCMLQYDGDALSADRNDIRSCDNRLLCAIGYRLLSCQSSCRPKAKYNNSRVYCRSSAEPKF